MKKEQELLNRETGESFVFEIDRESLSLELFKKVFNEKEGKVEKEQILSKAYSSLEDLIENCEKEFQKIMASETEGTFVDDDNQEIEKPMFLGKLILKEGEKKEKSLKRKISKEMREIEKFLKEIDGNDEARKKIWKNGESTKESLADLFNYVVLISKNSVNRPLTAGVSKFGGRPYLPKNFVWPKEKETLHFLFQINLKEVKPFDLEDKLPEKGMISVFANEEEYDGGVAFFHDDVDLVKTSHPTESSAKKEKSLSFYSSFYFGEDGDPEEITNQLEVDFLGKISSILGQEEYEKLYNLESRFFGEPLDFQGVDGLVFGFDRQNCQMLLQVEYGEGFIFVGGEKEELENKRLERLCVAYQGT